MFYKYLLTILFSIPKWLRITLSITYLLIIAILSLLPANNFPRAPLFLGADKIIHVCIYLGLAWLVCWSIHSERKTSLYTLIIFFSIGWGAMMELFQFMMHLGRSFELYDILGNSIGAIIGALVYILMIQQKKKLEGVKMRG